MFSDNRRSLVSHPEAAASQPSRQYLPVPSPSTERPRPFQPNPTVPPRQPSTSPRPTYIPPPTSSRPGYPYQSSPQPTFNEPSSPQPSRPSYPQPDVPTPSPPGYPYQPSPQPTFNEPSSPQPSRPSYPQPDVPTPSPPGYPYQPSPRPTFNEPSSPQPSRPSYPQPDVPKPSSPGYPYKPSPQPSFPDLPSSSQPPQSLYPQPSLTSSLQPPGYERPDKPSPAFFTDNESESDSAVVTGEEQQQGGFDSTGGVSIADVADEFPLKQLSRHSDTSGDATFQTIRRLRIKRHSYDWLRTSHAQFLTSAERTIVAGGGSEEGSLTSEGHPPHIHQIDVQCAKDQMTINLEFNTPFDGVIYSKVHQQVFCLDGGNR
ncbi:unnamed protein product [Timema podura]|uniref:Uncharacterized protein n=1 Tax=Timema podura TaxID=61482 RepID=A0ABN7NY40_TIMPD|nr:unnamed protein product [Timema podura]